MVTLLVSSGQNIDEATAFVATFVTRLCCGSRCSWG